MLFKKLSNYKIFIRNKKLSPLPLQNLTSKSFISSNVRVSCSDPAHLLMALEALLMWILKI